MTLEELRSKALFQNTIDVWIMRCEENDTEWFDIDAYRAFISHLLRINVKMQKFPLCIKESGGMFHRGRDKTQLLDALSKFDTPDVMAYTLKLNDETLNVIRTFKR
ncbi:MAG: hypothetical protein EX285_06030 [Thaumarchaeota archaeon]|nr:hypothetical protein [Nitrososphaerota archaeon]